MGTLEHWITLCASAREFVDNYNRLRGTSIAFEPTPRTPIEAAIDMACGHVPTITNDPGELAGFIEFCADMLQRIPAPAL